MRFILGWVFFIFWIAGSAAAQHAQTGKCAVVVAARPSLTEAQAYRTDNPGYEISEIYLSENGWYAMVADYIDSDDAPMILKQRKSRDLIPDDSYCTTGVRFVKLVWARQDGMPGSPLDPATGLLAEFDARPLSHDEKRFLQAALSLEGDYDGRLDGKWGANSQASLEQWSLRKFGGLPLNLHAAILAAIGDATLSEGDWDTFYDPVLAFSMQVPFKVMSAGDDDGAGLNLVALDDSFDIIVVPTSDAVARSYHRRLVSSASAEYRAAPYLVRDEEFWVTAFSDGLNRLYERTDFDRGAGFALTALFTAKSREGYAFSNLAIASYQMGPQSDLALPSGGVLMHLLQEVAVALEDDAQMTTPSPSAAKANGIDGNGLATPPVSSGSGFYINTLGSVMTNAHVVEGCRRLSVGGRVASLVATDQQLDLAVINVDGGLPGDGEVLSFATKPVRLNADVTVAGYPLNGFLQTINVTRGSVSALKGMQDDITELQITAPVQAGNSGGPISDRYGQVIGVVVAKMNSLYVADATGDLPQNVNFGVRGSIARIFAEANGISYSQTDRTDVLAPEDLAELLQKATVLVECF